MVDFSTLSVTSSSAAETDPRKIFQHLVKPEGVNELYASQSDILASWFSNRSTQNSVLKLPTGGGKSIVGLLISQSSMNELKLPSVYLGPTRQLVDQVRAEAERFGISTCSYLSSKEGLRPEFYDATAVCITTYDAMFNGRSKFGTSTKDSDVPQLGSIILDDAHAAFETVWRNYTFAIDAKSHLDLYKDLCARFRGSFSKIGRLRTFDEVVSGQEHYVMEVPYWEWIARADEIGQAIQAYGADKIDMFSWQHVRDDFHVCHALVSKDNFTIVPIVPSIMRSSSFANSRRRIFMSATIADDSEVIRTFAAKSKEVAHPLVAASLAGVGERMILVPALMPLPLTVKASQLTPSLIKDVTSHHKNTAILTPSFKNAETWQQVANVPSNGEESVALIDKLYKERGAAVVLPRRYDGIDLPGEICRLLVLDGLPYGESDYDAWRISVLAQGAGNTVLAQRVEQAIGRASRGTSDYCVVVLSGADLVSWIGRNSNQQHLSSGTKKQIEIGLVVSKAVNSEEEFVKTAWQCLGRDNGWRTYHASEMASAAQPSPPNQDMLEMWEAERDGVEGLRVRRFSEAVSAFDRAIDKATDAVTKGWFHQLKARAAFQSGNTAQSEQWQAKAYDLNMRLTEPLGQVAVKPLEIPGQQAALICHKLAGYMHAAVALQVFEDTVALLTHYSTSGQFESSLASLFEWLGFSSNRPDELYKTGPDVLAISGNGVSLIIEAKSRKKQKNKLTKTLHGQILSHENWFNANYSPNQKRVRIVVYPTNESEDNAGTQGTLVMTFDVITGLISDARQLLKACASSPHDQCGLMAAQKLKELKLTSDGIVARLGVFTDVL